MFNQIKNYRNELMRRGSTYFAIGRDIYDYGKDLIQERLNERPVTEDLDRSAEHKTQEQEALAQPSEDQKNEKTQKERKRRNMQKKFEVPEPNNAIEKGKQESLAKSQGVSDHSGSSYHGPGKPGEKSNAGMWQRNFDNHQGN
jgi:hypothetical protein